MPLTVTSRCNMFLAATQDDASFASDAHRFEGESKTHPLLCAVRALRNGVLHMLGENAAQWVYHDGVLSPETT